MEKAQIDIECDGEDSNFTVNGEVMFPRNFPIEENRAMLIGEIMCMRNRDLLTLSLERLMAEKLNY